MNSQTFFSELQKIISTLPKRPIYSPNSEDCDFADRVIFGKNLKYCFDSQHCVDSMYIADSYSAVDCIDGDYLFESQSCYECVGTYKTFNCAYQEQCEQTQDCLYGYKLFGCHDCFGCVQLKNKSFCIFNRQLSEEDYRKKVEQLKKLPAEKILAMVEELKNRLPRIPIYEGDNENTPFGNYIWFDKNCYMLFDGSWDENCAYLYDSFHNKNCLDMTYSGENMELSYESIDSEQSFNCNYIFRSSNSQDSSYIINCVDVKDCLGCVNLAHKQYCILNRQYSKEDYERLAPQILEQLKAQNAGWANLVC